MLPSKDVRLQLGELLAADATTLAQAVLENVIRLVIASFVPNEDLVPADLTFATFTGSAAKDCGLGTQPVGVDPVTGDQVITLLSPVGGWRFECTAAPTPAQTVWGFALLDSTSAVLLGTALLPTPVLISEVGDEVNLGVITITLVQQPAS